MKRFQRTLGGSLLLTFTCAISGQVEAITVGELLREESVAMLKVQQSTASGVATPTFDLVGIWGVESRLHAQLRYRGQIVEFVQGERVAVHPFGQRFQLLAIEPPCLAFRFKGVRQRICVKERRSAG